MLNNGDARLEDLFVFLQLFDLVQYFCILLLFLLKFLVRLFEVVLLAGLRDGNQSQYCQKAQQNEGRQEELSFQLETLSDFPDGQ